MLWNESHWLCRHCVTVYCKWLWSKILIFTLNYFLYLFFYLGWESSQAFILAGLKICSVQKITWIECDLNPFGRWPLGGVLISCNACLMGAKLLNPYYLCTVVCKSHQFFPLKATLIFEGPQQFFQDPEFPLFEAWDSGF